MFLWVTDFYSFEKIILAFPKIVLLYLKIAGDWNCAGGLVQLEREGGRRGLYCLVTKSWVPHLVLEARSGQRDSGEDGG